MDQDTLLADYLNDRRHAFKAAVNRVNRDLAAARLAPGEPLGMKELLGFLYAQGWLQRHVHPRHRQAVAAASRNPAFALVAQLLGEEERPEGFLTRYLAAHAIRPDTPCGALLAAHGGDAAALTARVLERWRAITPFAVPYQQGVRAIQARQKALYQELLGKADRERLALLDALPDPGGPTRFPKVGLIPHMACPQSCRHCLFVWRPPLKGAPDPAPLFDLANRLTESLLFTGGDLAGHLGELHRAIRTLGGIRSFAILLNGASATSRQGAEALFQGLENALNQRPPGFPPAAVTLQISCDDFHQELLADRHGKIRERIPVANIAHLMEAATRHPRIRLVLLHKQTRLNFGPALFRQGVIARLGRELARRGRPLQVLSVANGPRPKGDPLDPDRSAPLIRDALLALADAPRRPIHLMSSPIDGYGRAALLDPSEFVDERLYLERILAHGPPEGERFDSDPMLWYDGTVTLFQSSLYPLGNLYRDGEGTLLARWRKDPLLRALERFERRLLPLCATAGGELPALLARATGPHHLFQQLVESAPVRLAITRELLKNGVDARAG